MRHGTCEGTAWLISHGKVIGSDCALKREVEDHKCPPKMSFVYS